MICQPGRILPKAILHTIERTPSAPVQADIPSLRNMACAVYLPRDWAKRVFLLGGSIRSDGDHERAKEEAVQKLREAIARPNML